MIFDSAFVFSYNPSIPFTILSFMPDGALFPTGFKPNPASFKL
ncbi:hypothetical protein P3K84_28010 [Bacillus cereus]